MGAIIGYFPANEEQYKEALKKFKDYLRSLDAKVKDKEFVVGDKLTLADLFLATILNLPFALILDAGFTKAIPNLTKYYTGVRSNSVVEKYFGKARFAGKGIKPKFIKA